MEPVALPGSSSKRNRGSNEATCSRNSRLAQDLGTDTVALEMAATMLTVSDRVGDRTPEAACEQVTGTHSSIHFLY